MVQQLLVSLIVVACAGWLGYQGWRFFRPRPNGKLCGGGCCDGEKEPAPRPDPAAPAPTVMISSDDLRTRLRARKSS